MALLPVSGRNPVLFWLLCALAADCLQRKLSGKLEQRIGQHGLERQTRLRGVGSRTTVKQDMANSSS